MNGCGVSPAAGWSGAAGEPTVPPVPACERAAAQVRLIAAVQACRRCPTMEGRRRVLGYANGPPDAWVMFIAEAPGRRGGEVTGIPLTRDQSGRRFARLLALTGLAREQVFITNAVLCNPRRQTGANRPPSAAEVRACSGWLRAQIALVNPLVVITLGTTALRALALIEPHPYRLRECVARPLPWNGRILVPLYHPSPRAGLSRSYREQEADFAHLRAILAHLPVPGTAPA
jgi:uracil-DNA glycosylase family 4